MCITLGLIILLIIFERVYKKELTKSFVVLYIYGLILKMVYEIAIQYKDYIFRVPYGVAVPIGFPSRVGSDDNSFYSVIKEEL